MAALPVEGNAAALFFWEAHNDVNARLRREDAQQAAGAQRLEGALPQDAPWHMPFPTSQDCEARAEQGAAPASASCRSPSGGYDAAAVLGFLRGAYGFGACIESGCNNCVCAQIAVTRGRAADMHRFISECCM